MHPSTPSVDTAWLSWLTASCLMVLCHLKFVFTLYSNGMWCLSCRFAAL